MATPAGLTIGSVSYTHLDVYKRQALAGFFGTGTDAILAKPKAKRERSAPKQYRDPATGTIWIGKGPRPEWITALVEAGTDIKTLLVTE